MRDRQDLRALSRVSLVMALLALILSAGLALARISHNFESAAGYGQARTNTDEHGLTRTSMKKSVLVRARPCQSVPVRACQSTRSHNESGLTAVRQAHRPGESPLAFRAWELPRGSEESVWGAGGVCLSHRQNPAVAMFLWLYEWNLFDAVEKGEHTHGTVLPTREISADQKEATVSSRDIELRFQAVEDGARIQLVITNRSDHDWPALAALIPCFNPGPRALRSLGFSDDEQTRTYFLSAGGLEPLRKRAIHFCAQLRPLLDQLSPSGHFVFSHKWPTAPDNASRGILIRESADGKWVTSIAWEDFVSVQGHNPWKCMHLSVRVGPLPRGQSKSVRGRLYLFQGNRHECLAKYQKDFG